ncbi:hypothetical protein [Enterococcus casseliflavus]|uniref:hypothetical protein n=1 Tax=Enterococcus casseliflavus TaxID=37734 RepID=UPI002DBD6854|nr:hypothetical protein [Enterococcus casseliflavus]MEB8399155.1 hypothetical protein [Enterococcus casseliflavus]
MIFASQIEKDEFNQEQIKIAQEEFSRMLNEHRVANGVGTVEGNNVLQRASEIRAEDLSDLYEHQRPNGHTN